MIDKKKFNDTFQYFDQDAILKIIDIFENELPGRFEKMEQQMLDHDYNSLAFSAHSMKSITASFMSAEPAEIAKKIEELAIRRSDEGLQELYVRLKSAAECLLLELKEIRNELSAKDHSFQNIL